MRILIITLLVLLGGCSQKENSAITPLNSDLNLTKAPTTVIRGASSVTAASSSLATSTEIQTEQVKSQNTTCAQSNETCSSLFPFLQKFYTPLNSFDVISEMEVSPGYRAVILHGNGPGASDPSSNSFTMKAESFGVFIVDSSNQHVLTLDMFPTGRMGDYDVKFGDHGDGHLTIIGSGSTYGDQSMKRKYFYDINTRKVISIFENGIDVNVKHIIEFNDAIYCIGNTDAKTSVVAKIIFSSSSKIQIDTFSTIQNEKIEEIFDLKKDNEKLILTSEKNQYVFTKNSWEKSKNPSPEKYRYNTGARFSGLPNVLLWVPIYLVQQQATDFELEGIKHKFVVWNNKISANGGGASQSGIYHIQGTTVEFYPLTQPTYELFRKLRPERVEDGYSKEGTSIETEIGASQIDGDRIRFGLGFYDGEGTTGIGGIGSFDFKSKKFEVTYLKDIADFSVYSMLVEPDTIWLGLGVQPEGAVYPQVIAKISRKDNLVKLYKTPNLVNTIIRVGKAIYVGTTDGIVIYGDDGNIKNIKFSINKNGGYSAIVSQ